MRAIRTSTKRLGFGSVVGRYADGCQAECTLKKCNAGICRLGSLVGESDSDVNQKTRVRAGGWAVCRVDRHGCQTECTLKKYNAGIRRLGSLANESDANINQDTGVGLPRWSIYTLSDCQHGLRAWSCVNAGRLLARDMSHSNRSRYLVGRYAAWMATAVMPGVRYDSTLTMCSAGIVRVA